MIYSFYSRANQMHQFLKFVLFWNNTLNIYVTTIYSFYGKTNQMHQFLKFFYLGITL
jgi:hypothetical protein